MNTCLFFDLDGTLIDSRSDLAAAVNHMRASYGLEALAQDLVTSFVGNGIAKLIERSLAGTDIAPAPAQDRMMRYYSQHLTDHTRLYSGVRTALAELSAAGFINIVITNKSEQAARQILNKLEVLKYFDRVCGGGGAYPMKPEPDALNAAMADFSGDPERSCMLGDHYTDLEAARRAGLKGFYARYGFGDPRNAPYEMAVDSFADFARHVMLQKLSDLKQ